MQRPDGDAPQIDRILSRYHRVRLDTEQVSRRVRETGEFQLPTGDGVLDIYLQPHDIRAAGYLAVEEFEAGRVRQLPRSQSRTFRGMALQLGDSEARFSITGGRVEGVVLTPAEWYFIEPLRNFSPGSDPSEMVVYRRSDIRPDVIGTCAASLAERVGHAHEMVEPQILADASGISVAEIATEADHDYFLAAGGAEEANASILDILNQVDGVYRMQLSISLQVSYQHVWSTPDDPYESTAPSAMLAEFRNHWNTNFYSVPYDLAHMWTGKNMDGSTIGIAYLGTVCDARSYSYGISQRFTSSPGKFILTAHEIGHNFGATHTEQANPPQADCGNTIMNSSVGTGFVFCPYSRSEITSYAALSGSCLDAETDSNPCDINRDGGVNALDLQLLVNALLGIPGGPGGGDLNGDTRTDVLDLQLLINVILGLRSCSGAP
jgi:hypothetical protein